MNRQERREGLLTALQFLARAKLKGAEVEAFNIVVGVIRSIIDDDDKEEAEQAAKEKPVES